MALSDARTGMTRSPVANCTSSTTDTPVGSDSASVRVSPLRLIGQT